MATEKQIEANRRNALKSTGPRTPEGKDASRRNALRHGLAALTLLPEQDEAAARARAEEWAEDLGAKAPFQRFLVDTMAADSIRAERCARQYDAIKARQAARAEACWDEDRAAEVARLGRRLARDPEMVLHRLRATRHGCGWLVGRWHEWIADVEAKGVDGPLRDRALDLLGIDRERRDGPACDMTVDAARAEVGRLEQRIGGCLAELDEADRAMAAAGLGPDDLDARRARRYEAGCLRRIQWAHAQIRRSLQGKPASRRPAGWTEYEYPGPAEPVPPPSPRTNPIAPSDLGGTKPISSAACRPIAPPTRAEVECFRPQSLPGNPSFRDAMAPAAPIGNRRLRRAMARAAAV